MRIGDRDRDGRGRGPSRRDVMRAAVMVTLVTSTALVTGCDIFDDAPPRPADPDPVTPLIAGALALAAGYEEAVTAFPELGDRLRPVAEAHRAHAAELSRVTGTTPSTGPAATGTGSTGPTGDARAALAALRSAEQQGREVAVAACLAAAPGRAALVGSIAAARATHLEVLR